MECALFYHLIRLAFVTCDEINLLAFNLVTQGRVWFLDNNTLAQLTRHLMHVILIEIEFLGHLVVREVESHEIQHRIPTRRG